MRAVHDPQSIKLFSAVSVGVRWHSSLLYAQRELLSRYPTGVRWSPAENLHMTVRFIGNVPQATAHEVIQLWSSLSLPLPLPTLQLEGLGCFPLDGPERVLWAGVRVHSGAWGELVQRVDATLASAGIVLSTSDPILHVTLGRVRDPTAVRGIRQVLSQLDMSAEPLRVDTVGLFRSLQGPKGSEYILQAETAPCSHSG